MRTDRLTREVEMQLEVPAEGEGAVPLRADGFRSRCRSARDRELRRQFRAAIVVVARTESRPTKIRGDHFSCDAASEQS